MWGQIRGMLTSTVQYLYAVASKYWTVSFIDKSMWLNFSCLFFWHTLCPDGLYETSYITLYFISFSALLSAQTERSLDECIRIAWKQNPSLRNSEIDIKENRMNYISAVGSFLPRVSVSAEAGRNFGHSIDPSTNGYTNNTFDEGTVGLDMTLSFSKVSPASTGYVLRR